jgi:hypothetical protein
MAFSEQKIIDKIEVAENGAILVREASRVFNDDQMIAQTFHRSSFAPGSDVSGMPDNVQAVAKAIWTEDVVAAYKASITQ